MASVLSAGTTSNTALNLSADTTGVLQFQTNGTTAAMTIDTSQNVGIGTSSPPSDTNLTVLGNFQTGFYRNVTSGARGYFLNIGAKTSGGFADGAYVFGAVESGDATGYLTFGTRSGSATAERMRIDSSGRVGIGTSSPAFPLDVRAATSVISAVSTTGTNSAYMYVSNTGGDFYLGRDNSAGTTFGTGTGYSAVLYSAGAYPMVFFTNSTERMRITSGGDLLVGTTTSRGVGTFFASSGNAMGVEHSGSGTVTAIEFRQGAPSAVCGSISLSNGNATAYNTSSDHRLKENIAPMTGALAKVAQLKPCTYTWKATGETGQGFIAHELQEVVPDAVTGEKDAVNADGSIKPQGVDTSFLVATLTAAIQELKAELDATKAEVAALKGVK